tara:strand:- start:33 stop:158 length:126 start_codon:yes stop_codon:yes gene_type:complete
MAKMFGNEPRVFLKTKYGKAFIQVAERAPNGAHSKIKMVSN